MMQMFGNPTQNFRQYAQQQMSQFSPYGGRGRPAGSQIGQPSGQPPQPDAQYYQNLLAQEARMPGSTDPNMLRQGLGMMGIDASDPNSIAPRNGLMATQNQGRFQMGQNQLGGLGSFLSGIRGMGRGGYGQRGMGRGYMQGQGVNPMMGAFGQMTGGMMGGFGS